MTTRYQKSQIEDVAKILSKGARTVEIVTEDIARDFADLFAADNPNKCCGEAVRDHFEYWDPSVPKGEHHYQPGFNRARFLAACGLEEEAQS
ncbi:hypothetical protein LCGC14_2928230 [marine sediment metagenome]|uniref:Uncharacterized protein n=1 Tax=marine sediment metagenome TaxID=412755 RepID=A0A0F9ACS9_9ZZZZ